MKCTICFQSILPGEIIDDFCGDQHHENPSHCVAAVARRCAEKLETEGVMLEIIPGETKQDRVIRYAKAMAAEIRAEFKLAPKRIVRYATEVVTCVPSTWTAHEYGEEYALSIGRTEAEAIENLKFDSEGRYPDAEIVLERWEGPAK